MNNKNEFVGWLRSKGFGQNQQDINDCYDRPRQLLKVQPIDGDTVHPPSSPTDDEITLVISEIVNHYQSGLANSLHHQYFINKVRCLFQADDNNTRENNGVIPSQVISHGSGQNS